MVQHYSKIAFRSLWRDKVHSIINVLGLSLGIACCILISLFVKDELTFDAFHTKAERIYRVYVKENWGENQEFFNTVTPFPMGPALKENFGEVEAHVRILNTNASVKHDDQQVNETVIVAGSDFFSVFDFEVIDGTIDEALQKQNNTVLTASYAKKYFGEVNPIGKNLTIQLRNSFEDFVVAAVVKDVPTNSSIQFNILLSDLLFPKLVDAETLTSGWFNVNPETYILVREETDVDQLLAKFPSVFKTILGEENFNQSKYQPGLQPLTSIHLDTSYPVGIAPVSNGRYSYILAAIALLILIVACINFVTLSIGQSIRRSKEVGIRKVVGSLRQQLIVQFIGEALILTMLSTAFGVLLAYFNLPLFNDLSGKQLLFPFDAFLLSIVVGMIVIIGLLAGSYPAFILSSFKPISVLKGQLTFGSSRQTLRKILVGVQLVLSIFLISSTLTMQRQLTYLRTKDLGFAKDQVLVVRLKVPQADGLAERVAKGFEVAEQFKVALAKIPDVVGICATSHDFGNGSWTSIGFTDDKNVYRDFFMNVIDERYTDVLKMKLLAGRSFSAEMPSDKRRAVLVNEAFVKAFGWDDALGKKIPGARFPDHEIIGVVKDFNFSSLYTKIAPLVLVQDANLILQGVQNINISSSPIPKLLIRIRPNNVKETLRDIGKVWTSLTPEAEFNFDFVDEAMAAQYRSDQNLGKIVGVATLLAIIIGGLGLYGLASLAMLNRVKEISIRKVLGASENSLLVLLSKEYVYLILVCLVLSVPATYFLMQTWLLSFEYRTHIGIDVFFLAGGLSMIIAVFTIGFQTLRTARTPPAENLKTE